MERLIIEFPKLLRQDLERQDKVVESLRWNNKHRKNIIKDWQRHRKALQESAEGLLEKLMDEALEKLAKQLEFVKQEKLQQRIYQEKSGKQSDYQQRLEFKEKLKAEAEEKKQQELKKKENERNTRAVQSKKVATEFKTIKKQQEDLEKKRKTQEIINQKKKNQETISRNRFKVDERQAVQEQKIIERLEEQEQAELKKEEEKMRIEKAISQYQHIPKVDIDSDRVKQNTKSKDAKKVQYDKADKVVLYQQTGFTVDNLMKDMRYRLSSMINDAGLQNSEYAKRVLQVAPHVQPRKDTIASHNFK